MRVLIGCEYSGTVRDAFLALGHDAMSCDLLPTDVPGPHHQGDVRDVIGDGWDLAIFHPSCTYLTKSGVRWLYEDCATGTAVERWKLMVEAAVFFRELLHTPIPRIAVENPQMHAYATSIIGSKADQYVQPWMFGHAENKATGLWLRGLPPLVISDDAREQMRGLSRRETDRIHYAAPGAERWKTRSTTFPGVAAAMAAQWSDLDARAVA